MNKKPSTSWGSVAGWYDKLVEDDPDSYQAQVILPGLLRLLEVKPGEKILELGAGQGFFARALASLGAEVSAVELSPELVALAKKRLTKEQNVKFFVGSAENPDFLSTGDFDTALFILSLQNIKDAKAAVAAAAKLLRPGGRLVIVLNHPSFRLPKYSSWEYDEEKDVEYRRLDRYLSEYVVPIEMHPGMNPDLQTVSFHRPLQSYFKYLEKSGLVVSRLEEWISHRRGPRGRRAKSNDRARVEFPLFLFLCALKIR